jgi:hypothetical protein
MTRIQVDYECGPADQSCTSAVDEKRLIWIQWVEFHKALSVVFLLGSNSAASACPSWLVNGILQHRNLLNNTDAMQCDAISAASLQAPCNLCPGLTMTPDTKPESLLLVAWRCCKRWEQNLNTVCFRPFIVLQPVLSDLGLKDLKGASFANGISLHVTNRINFSFCCSVFGLTQEKNVFIFWKLKPQDPQASNKDGRHILSIPPSTFRGSDSETHVPCASMISPYCPWPCNKGFADWCFSTKTAVSVTQ